MLSAKSPAERRSAKSPAGTRRRRRPPVGQCRGPSARCERSPGNARCDGSPGRPPRKQPEEQRDAAGAARLPPMGRRAARRDCRIVPVASPAGPRLLARPVLHWVSARLLLVQQAQVDLDGWPPPPPRPRCIRPTGVVEYHPCPRDFNVASNQSFGACFVSPSGTGAPCSSCWFCFWLSLRAFVRRRDAGRSRCPGGWVHGRGRCRRKGCRSCRRLGVVTPRPAHRAPVPSQGRMNHSGMESENTLPAPPAAPFMWKPKDRRRSLAGVDPWLGLRRQRLVQCPPAVADRLPAPPVGFAGIGRFYVFQ